MTERRIWFAKPQTADELTEALSIVRSMCEEMLLGKVEIRLDLIAKSAPLTDIQVPARNADDIRGTSPW